MAFQRSLHDATLHAFPAAVDQPHFQKSSLVRRVEVFLDDRTHVARRDCVEVERGLDRDSMWNVRRLPPL
jgi:hypothetical protein